MSYLVSKLQNVPIAILRKFLEKDKPFQVENNMFSEDN